MRDSPANVVATAASPGTYFAKMSDFAPQRPYTLRVAPTHESGDSEILHISRSMVAPKRLPHTYHSTSASTAARIATNRICNKGSSPIDRQGRGHDDRWIGRDRQTALFQQHADEHDPQAVNLDELQQGFHGAIVRP